jgi:hypothetical protein
MDLVVVVIFVIPKKQSSREQLNLPYNKKMPKLQPRPPPAVENMALVVV